jgi:peptide/nickel transport system ATP-binding protein
MTARNVVLEVKDLSVQLQRGKGPVIPILSDVSFTLASDEVLGIIGESGSGKTVLSRALVNWIREPLRVRSGSLLYRGRDLLQLPESEMQRLRGREIAYIGSDPGSALDPTVFVGDQIVEKLRAVEPSLNRRQAEAQALRLLDAVRIPSPKQRFHEFPFQFSGGMMQRAMIVDALVTNPAFLVADNITQPLDVTVAAQILRLLRELQRDFNTAIIFVCSALGVVNAIADNVLVLAGGKVVEEQPVRSLMSAPQHNYTRRLIQDFPRIWEEKGASGPSSVDATGKAEAVLSVRDVAKSYEVRDRNRLFGRRVVQAVRGVSFDAYKGENLGIVGESG